MIGYACCIFLGWLAGIVSFVIFAGHMWRKANPFRYRCMVKDCRFSTAGNDAAFIDHLISVHERSHQ